MSVPTLIRSPLPDVSKDLRREPRAQPRVEGKFLEVGGRRFLIKGVTYGTFAPNSAGELFPEPATVRQDMQQMRSAGVNTVRTYVSPPVWFLDLAAEHGLHVIASPFWEARQCLFDDAEVIQQVTKAFAAEVRSFAGHPALLMVCLGNEIPPQVAGTVKRRSRLCCSGCATWSRRSTRNYW